MSLPPDFKKKLSKIIQDRMGSRDSQGRGEYTQPDGAIIAALESTIPGQPVEYGSGEFYLVHKELSELYADAETLIRRYCELSTSNCAPDYHRLNDELKMLLNTTLTELLFLDTETAGFANNPLFLIGIMYFNGENFVIDQLFARDYSEESNLLHYFGEFASRFKVLITFNGKSFDVPFIRDRMVYHRKDFEWVQNHVDILHHSRRRWKGEVPDCKLQTLESYICNRQRVGDIPSALVPAVYREFVRSGDARLLADIFHHNALDLITLVELTIMLLS